MATLPAIANAAATAAATFAAIVAAAAVAAETLADIAIVRAALAPIAAHAGGATIKLSNGNRLQILRLISAAVRQAPKRKIVSGLVLAIIYRVCRVTPYRSFSVSDAIVMGGILQSSSIQLFKSDSSPTAKNLM